MTGQQPFTLLTGATGQSMVMDAPIKGELQNELGVRAPANRIVLLEIEGVPSNRVQERTRVVRRIGITWPDLVHLRNQLNAMLDDAVKDGFLHLPAEQTR